MNRFNFSAVLCAALASHSLGQSIFSNPITGTNPGLSNSFTTGQTFNPNIQVSGIGRGSGVAGGNSTDSYRATSWSQTTLDLTDYFTWTLTPNADYAISLSSFTFTASNTGFGNPSITVEFRSSLDGFSSNLTGATGTGGTIDLTGSQFQNLNSGIEFRMYAYGANNANSTFSINDFSYNGMVTPVPEPMTMFAVTAASFVVLALRRRSNGSPRFRTPSMSR